MRLESRPASTALPPADDPGNPELVALIRDEIRQGGPITFARFMERALYEPGLGYYATSASRPTREGDFLTSPELHPIFGHALARQVEQMSDVLGRPNDFLVREYGAGSGTLARAITAGLEPTPLAGLRYEQIDLPERTHARLQREPSVGVILANEFLDALPVNRVIRLNDRLREVYVDWQGERFVEVAGALSDGRLESALADVQMADGQRVEVNLRMADWLAAVALQLTRGYVIVIDYGLPERELYSAARGTGTLRAFRQHHVSSDVLAGVGRQDLTAHINLDALERDARAAGFEVLGRTRQAEFLLGCGLDELYRSARDAADSDWGSAVELRAAVRRLLDPAALGGYAVVILGKHTPSAVLRGLSFPSKHRS